MDETNGSSPHHRGDIGVSFGPGVVTLRSRDNPVTMTSDEATELARRIFGAATEVFGDEPEERHWIRLPMQYLTAWVCKVAEGKEGDTSDAAEQEVAQVHCWIKDQTVRNAAYVAAGWICDAGWEIVDEIEQRMVMRDDFTDTDFLRFYEQALTDDEVFVYEHDGDAPEDSDDDS